MPRDRRTGAQTCSFYGAKNRSSSSRGKKRAASASTRIRELSEQNRCRFQQLADCQGYGSGEHLSDRTSVSLDDRDSDDYDDPENTGNNYGPQQELMYTFPGSAQQPLNSSSTFNSRQSQLSLPQLTPRRNHATQGSHPHQSESYCYPSTQGSQIAQENTDQFPSPDSSLRPDFGQMLQQQQVLLMRILNQQDEIQEKQKLFEKRLEGIEERVANGLQSVSSSSSSPTGSQDKPKRVVSRRLSVRKLTPTPRPLHYCSFFSAGEGH